MASGRQLEIMFDDAPRWDPSSLEAALADLHRRTDRGFPLPGDVGDLAGMFTTKSKKGLISVAARSTDPALSAAALNAVLSAYEANNEAARRRHFDIRRSELSAREKELQKSLDALNDQYLDTGGEHDAGTLSKAHVAKTAQLEVLEERIAELENTIDQMQATGGVGADVGSVEIQRATLLDKATADMTYERAQRLAALETLRRRYRSAHPKLRAAEAELAILEEAIDERRDQIATLGKAGALTGGNSDSSDNRGMSGVRRASPASMMRCDARSAWVSGDSSDLVSTSKSVS